MRFQLLVIAVAGFLIAADAPKEDAKKETDRWQGNWVATAVESAGNAFTDEQAKSMKFAVKGNKYTYTIGEDYHEVGNFKVDAAKKPKTVDVTIIEGTDKGEAQLGIYELDKDTLKICFAKPGKDKTRPKDFTTNADNEQLLITFKREKS